MHNAIVWQDKRTSIKCHELNLIHGEQVKQKTGLPLDPYFSASKMQWLLENVNKVKTAAENNVLAFGTIDSFLLWKLTGGKVHATDITNASRTLLFNIYNCTWDKDLLEIFNIPESSLPKVLPNTSDFGVTSIKELPKDIPINSMIGDQQSASIGQVCFKKGMLKSTYGTGCFAMLNTGTEPVTSTNGLITTIAYQTDGKPYYALEGSIFIAGSAIQWLRDKLNLITSSSEVEALASSTHDSDDVYFIPAFAGLGAPYWKPTIKASIIGMTLDTSKATIVRAALDAVVFQTNDLIKAMESDINEPIKELRVDGGMVVNNWLLQRLSDILNINIKRPLVIETTALGAAYLAGLQYGFYNSLEDIEQNWQVEKEASPKMSNDTRNNKIAGWADAIKLFLK